MQTLFQVQYRSEGQIWRDIPGGAYRVRSLADELIALNQSHDEGRGVSLEYRVMLIWL